MKNLKQNDNFDNEIIALFVQKTSPHKTVFEFTYYTEKFATASTCNTRSKHFTVFLHIVGYTENYHKQRNRRFTMINFTNQDRKLQLGVRRYTRAKKKTKKITQKENRILELKKFLYQDFF